MKQITVSPTASNKALFAAAFAALALLAVRAFTSAQNAATAARVWLQSKHTFAEDDGDGAVILTGWQYIGVGVLTCLACLLLSIDWDAML